MELTNRFAVWASRNARQAVLLIIVIEFTNAILGIMVGSELLREWSPWNLMILILSVVLMNVCLKRHAHIRLIDLAAQSRFVFQKRFFVGLFCLNLFAYTIAGGIMGHMVAYPEASSNLYGSLTTTISESSSNDKKVSFREKMRQSALKHTEEGKSNAGRRIGYIALFLLGVALAYIGAALACNLACSGVGFGAVLVLLLSTGVLAGGFYFLGRGLDKNIKPYKDMTRDERKREGRRYLWTLLGTVGALALWILIASI